MKLDLISYCEDENLASEWRLKGCRLRDINLIVGKNASGKTRILKSINLLADLLSGNKNLRPDSKYRNWELTFDSENKNDEKIYKLITKNGKVVEEKYNIGNQNYLTRGNSGEGQIFANEIGSHIKFQVPTDELTALKKRDTIQHPFFEDIYTWSNSLRYYQFGTSLGKETIALFNKFLKSHKKVDFKNTDEVISVFTLGKQELGSQFIEAIKSDMLSIGYNITDVGTQTPSVLFLNDEEIDEKNIKPVYIFVKEKDLDVNTEQNLMSQGMFRTLSLIIQINHSLLLSQPSCILIDDIGEGLDFERSQAMIKLLINKAKTGLVQLVMTTNDRFIMNGVPLEYWSVIERKPGLAKLHNINNSREIFEDFKFTGLNNFDFFATDFYLEGFEEEEIIEE